MGRETSESRERKIVSSIVDLVDNSQEQTTLIKAKWRDNYDMFVYGSRWTEKLDWQTNFCVNKLETSTRAAQGRLVNTLVNIPDWYQIEPKSCYNAKAEKLAPIVQKAMDYYLDASHFKRHAGTFFLNALISMGNIYVGWKDILVPNPEYVIDKSDKERRKIQQQLAKNVTNPQVEQQNLSADSFESALLRELDSFVAEAQGEAPSRKQIEPYMQIGSLDLMDINHERTYWDPNVMYMEDSAWRAWDYEVNRWELNAQAKLGYFDREVIKRVGSQKDQTVVTANSDIRYKKITPSAAKKSDKVKLTVYFGPLIVDNEVVKNNYFAIVANDSTLIKEGEYPYWEPPMRKTPVISAAVRQVPYRATGAGLGDSASQLQKIYDSNWQLICDTFRMGIGGVNVVNYQNLVDKSQLDEGIYPGITVQMRGNPSENFEHINLTSNLENQAHPVQSMLEGAIDSLTGINELMVGGNNQFSRTSAKETDARLSAGNQNVNIIALDLEQNFLLPFLQTVMARVLQFGLPSVTTNLELRAIFTDEELSLIEQLTAGDRIQMLNQWFNFRIKGFSNAQDKNEARMRDNELLQIINGNGPLAQLINLPEFMKEYFKNLEIKDPDRLLLMTDSPLMQVTSENQVLQSGHFVQPSETDDHAFHIQNQGALAQSPYATPAMKQHVQMHMMMQQQMQAMQQSQQQGAEQIQ